MKNLISFKNHIGIDKAVLSFDLNADLRPAFHWNLKQLFVYVVAEYETSANPLNQVIIWDKIVKSQKEASLKLQGEHVKYALIDQGAELRGKKVTLKLMWDHMPLTGRLYVEQDGNKTFTLPDEYTKSAKM